MRGIRRPTRGLGNRGQCHGVICGLRLRLGLSCRRYGWPQGAASRRTGPSDGAALVQSTIRKAPKKREGAISLDQSEAKGRGGGLHATPARTWAPRGCASRVAGRANGLV